MPLQYCFGLPTQFVSIGRAKNWKGKEFDAGSSEPCRSIPWWVTRHLSLPFLLPANSYSMIGSGRDHSLSILRASPYLPPCQYLLLNPTYSPSVPSNTPIGARPNSLSPSLIDFTLINVPAPLLLSPPSPWILSPVQAQL